jgi:RNA polymerase sigma-70 factor (ECF subfamily)
MTDAAQRLHEQLLVLRCQAGDEDAFEELVARYHPRLRYYLRRILPRAEHADDVLQEVWLAVFRALPRLADPAALAAWLYRIARDKAAVQWRGRPPERLLDASDLVEEPSQGNEFRQEDAQEIHASLDQLSPEQREVLVLRFLEDMTYQQIAKVTGCPIGTVRSRLYYAKSALRQAIQHRRST